MYCFGTGHLTSSIWVLNFRDPRLWLRVGGLFRPDGVTSRLPGAIWSNSPSRRSIFLYTEPAFGPETQSNSCPFPSGWLPNHSLIARPCTACGSAAAGTRSLPELPVSYAQDDALRATTVLERCKPRNVKALPTLLTASCWFCLVFILPSHLRCNCSSLLLDRFRC